MEEGREGTNEGLQVEVGLPLSESFLAEHGIEGGCRLYALAQQVLVPGGVGVCGPVVTRCEIGWCKVGCVVVWCVMGGCNWWFGWV